MTDKPSPEHLAIDTGGTFTDYCALYPGGDVVTGKVSSTPDDPSRSIETVFSELNVSGGTRFVHGTTVATNALLEDELADVLFVVNEGLEGLLKVGRGQRRDLYDLNPDPDRYPFRDVEIEGVPVRDHPFMDTSGFLSERDAARLRTRVREHDPDIVAVCLVHSYKHHEGEQSIKHALEPVDVPVVLSSEVLPRFREFERGATTVINAGLRPIISRYLRNISEIDNAPGELQVMASDRGTMSVDEAVNKPVRTVLSGPTAGLIGARGFVDGDGGLITMDIGGTSTDVSLLEEGQVPLSDDKEIGSYPIAQPVADIHTIGSGGGSILWVDDGGHLRVGPRSAGADPGPACYGDGGPPTVTDALVVLGRIPAEHPISDDLDISKDSATGALETLGEPLDRSALDVARGAIRIVISQLAEAVRSVTVERGRRPDQFPLVAFGGGGGLYGARLADELGIPRVFVPRQAGIGSAEGLLRAPESHQASISPLNELPLSSEELPGLESLLERAPGWESSADELRLEAECQFVGQTHTVTVSVTRETSCDQLIDRFTEEYRDIYGYEPDEDRVELVHLNGFWLRDAPVGPSYAQDGPGGSGDNVPGQRNVFVGEEWVDVPLFSLESVDQSVEGPALFVGDTTTVYLPEAWTMTPMEKAVKLDRG